MTSFEADRFMGEHPEVAVMATAGGLTWVAWNHSQKGKPMEVPRIIGLSRGNALYHYKQLYHPEKVENQCGLCPAHEWKITCGADVDAKKYRRIVEAYQDIHPKSGDDQFNKDKFRRYVIEILGDDLKPPHCNECGQPLEAKKEK